METCILSIKIEKRRRIKLPARATLWYTAVSAIERGIAFIFTPVFTRLLSPEEYGVYPLYTSFMGILTVFITLELSGSAVYKGLSKFKGREQEFLRSCTLLMCCALALALILYVILADITLAFTGLSRPVLLFLLLQVFLNGIINLYFSKCRYTYKYKSAAAISLAVATLSPALSFLLIRFSEYRAEGRIIGTLAVCALICLPLLFILVGRGGKIFPKDIGTYIIKLTLPLLPHYLATTLIAQSGKIAIGRFFGEGALAKYSIAFSLAYLLTVLSVGILSGLTPWINRKLSHGAGHLIDITLGKVYVLLAGAALIFLAFVPEALSFLAPKEYSDAIIAVYPIALSVLISFLCSAMYSIAIYCEKSLALSWVCIAVAGATILLHLSITSRLSYLGAALTQTLSSILSFTFYAIILGGVLKKREIKLGKYILATLIAAAFAALLYLCRGVFISRILLSLAAVLFIVPRAAECKHFLTE